MGYQMIYQPDREMPVRTNLLRRQTMIAVCFLAFAVIVRMFWEPGSQVLRQFLTPGELSTTEKAFVQLVDDLRQGCGLGSAVEIFCHQVIHGGF